MRKIKKVAVLGSGIMGSRIACHFANIGVQVLLLDIVPKDQTEVELKKGKKILIGTQKEQEAKNVLQTYINKDIL